MGLKNKLRIAKGMLR